MDIKKVVQLTNEQYEELLKNGQVEVNGEIKTKEEGTVYICPASESWAELNNKIDEALVKPNRVLHNPYSIEELEIIIARLREQYNETDSVVGFRCTMKKGQQLKVSTAYTMYLNETLRETDYTCENDSEMISIVLFGTGQNMNITSDLIQFRNNVETYMQVKNSPVVVEANMYRMANLLTMLGMTLSSSMYCEEFRGDKMSTGSYNSAPPLLPVAKRVKIVGTHVGYSFVRNNSYLEEADLDSVNYLYANFQAQPFSATSNSKLVLNFPNLLSINAGSSTHANSNSAIFHGVKHLIIGEKLQTLAAILIAGSCGTVELYCKDAKNNMINGLLGYIANVDYLYLCPDWNCGMSIAQVGGISVENITEIFNNLKDLTNEDAKTLTIQSSLYNSLDEDTLKIATRKNWTIAYA